MSMFGSLICAFTRHRYVLEKRLSRTSRKIGCTRCGKQWAMNDDCQILLPWDEDFEQVYAELEKFKEAHHGK